MSDPNLAENCFLEVTVERSGTQKQWTSLPKNQKKARACRLRDRPEMSPLNFPIQKVEIILRDV